jgi:hypothetical protein
MNWLIYHLGGKYWLLNKYRSQKDFEIEISSKGYELETTLLSGRKITTNKVGFVAVITKDGKSSKVGNCSWVSGELFSKTYNSALKCCLNEFERYLLTKKAN